MDKKDQDFEIKNRERRTEYIWIGIAFLSLFGIFYGFYKFDINSFHGAMIFISVVLFITSIICILMFRKRADDIDIAINHRKYIAHFRYSKEEWEEFLLYEHKFRLEEKKGIFYILTSITIIIFALFILIVGDTRLPMFVVMSVLVLMYTFMAFILPHITHYFRKIEEADVIIMEKGILLHRKFHTWDFPLSKLVGLEIEEKPFKHLKIAYEFWEKSGPRTYVVNIPIPKNNNVDLDDVMKKLGEANAGKMKSKEKTKRI